MLKMKPLRSKSDSSDLFFFLQLRLLISILFIIWSHFTLLERPTKMSDGMKDGQINVEKIY